MVGSLLEFKTYSFLFKEYRDGLLPSRRRLQEDLWSIGSWNFEDVNQVLARIGDQEIRFSLLDEKSLEVNQEILLTEGGSNWNTNNQRGKLTYQVAIDEMMDEGDERPKNFKCHFSGDYNRNPWWQMKLDQQYSVKTVKFFNLKNGAQSSNLEGATVFVGDTVCGKIGPMLPENMFITVVCKDLDAEPVSIFDKTEKKEYAGTKGNSIKIQASQPGVLMVCDIDVEIQVVD